eukprot:6491275-Amphidinium_carterae.4
MPTEASQSLVLLSLCEEVAKNRLRLSWLDTRWMLADGLTKGSVDRSQLRHAAENGYIELPRGSLLRHKVVQA